MTGRSHSRWIGIGLVAALAGCAAHGTEPHAAAAPSGASRASGVAADLAAADAAHGNGDKRVLASTLLRLGQRGARPLDDAVADDPVPAWRAAVADKLPPLRGRALGPGYVRGTLAPGNETSLNQLFLSGQAATIAADSQPQSELRLRIYDGDGKLVCDRTPAHARDCRFTPVFTQRYRIELSNGGARRVNYYLVLD